VTRQASVWFSNFTEVVPARQICRTDIYTIYLYDKDATLRSFERQWVKNGCVKDLNVVQVASVLAGDLFILNVVRAHPAR
jgi:hypothetical protein